MVTDSELSGPLTADSSPIPRAHRLWLGGSGARLWCSDALVLGSGARLRCLASLLWPTWQIIPPVPFVGSQGFGGVVRSVRPWVFYSVFWMIHQGPSDVNDSLNVFSLNKVWPKKRFSKFEPIKVSQRLTKEKFLQVWPKRRVSKFDQRKLSHRMGPGEVSPLMCLNTLTLVAAGWNLKFAKISNFGMIKIFGFFWIFLDFFLIFFWIFGFFWYFLDCFS